ncbi:MAG: tetratricopeptide repeat protein, partial [Spirochaetaceae bacterium]|nr:tetratricopeptide repeat protein [Spirochaetaceae bacterium]
EAEIAPQLAKVQAEMAKAGKTARLLNKAGVLYAGYGLWDRAEGYFTDAASKEDFAPAIVNLGNLALLRGESAEAAALFARALKKAPGDAKALLAAARAEHALENYGSARGYYDRLKKADPGLAAQYNYLELRGEDAKRAADAGEAMRRVPWSE